MAVIFLLLRIPSHYVTDLMHEIVINGEKEPEVWWKLEQLLNEILSVALFLATSRNTSL
jgi:hypothetical protein